MDKQQIQNKIDNLNKPKGSMGRLEELALQICQIQDTLTPELHHPCHLLFGADHGIEREHVSVSPRCITWQQMINFTRGGGGVNMFCRQHGFELIITDVGVDYDLSEYHAIKNCKQGPGTCNFLYKPAMSEAQMEACLRIGADTVDDCAAKGSNVISIGEMGIANTSPSSIWMHLLQGIPMEQCVGAGAGLDTPGIQHKLHVLQQSVDNFRRHGYDSADVRLVLRYFGGFEMVAAVGAMLRAAECNMIVMVDGFIMTACMLIASRMNPAVLQNAIFCHQGDEAGHKLMLEGMGAKGLLSLGLRLGEGTGALCAFPILQSAVNMINEMNNFANAKITKYF